MPETAQAILIGVAIIGSYLLLIRWYKRSKDKEKGKKGGTADKK